MSKLIEKILMESRLNESKNIGVLYHFTSFSGLLSILKLNCIKPHQIFDKNNDSKEVVSLTRDKLFYTTGDREQSGISTSIRIAIDGNRLSERYKIKPYNYFHRELISAVNDGELDYDPSVDLARPHAENETTESEEIVMTDELGIKDIKKYILNITVLAVYIGKMKETLEELKNILRLYNIPFNIEKP